MPKFTKRAGRRGHGSLNRVGSALTLAQAKHFEWLWHGTTQQARDAVPASVRKQVEDVLGHELSIS